MYICICVCIYMCDYLRVCTSRLRSFVNSFGKSQFLIAMQLCFVKGQGCMAVRHDQGV